MAKKDPKWNKFGSGYDPSHSGKGKMEPPEQKKIEPKKEEPILFGKCNDPNCPNCHPETALNKKTASEQQAPTATGRSFGLGTGRLFLGNRDLGEITFSDISSLSSAMRGSTSYAEIEERMMRDLFFGTAARPAATPPKEEPKEDKEYKAARKAVKKWLSKAPAQAFTDIVGNEKALEQLRDAIRAPVDHEGLYAAYGMKMPKGALLSGPPGCGKTMFARAAASEMMKMYGEEVEFISISGGELQSPYIGVTEGYIKAIFDFARLYKAKHGHPLLVFMDEAEVLLPDRTGRIRRVYPHEETQVATFLAEMDGMHESGAFVLLATNRPEVIDQAVLRDGRCEFKIVIKRPTPEAVEQILVNNFKDVLCAESSVSDLVFAAVEGLHDPHKVIMEAHMLMANLKTEEVKDLHQRHFLLEHIVSGAMAASIPQRAIRYAFARDKETGIAKGVTTADVLAAVNDLFEENKGLEHSFALNEFREEFLAGAKKAVDKYRDDK